MLHRLGAPDSSINVLLAMEAKKKRLTVYRKGQLQTGPSMAAVVLQGRSANGWVKWKTQQGNTLDEMKRQFVTVAN